MTETIIKGTGNSRSIRSVANIAQLAPTYESLLALLAGDGLPVDIGGLNEAGCQQIGDALNKANLLTDATAALYGLTGEAVPDDVLSAIIPLITAVQNTANDRGQIEIGIYTGTATSKRKISCSFPLKGIIMIGRIVSGSQLYEYSDVFPANFNGLHSSSSGERNVSFSGNSVTFSQKYSGQAYENIYNNTNTQYPYIALG